MNKEVVKIGKVLFVIAPGNFRDEELKIPKEMIEKNYEAEIASSTTNTVKGMLGMVVKPNLLLSQAISKIDEYSAVIFVGGIGTKNYFNNSDALELAKQSAQKGKITAAICIAPIILANAGILKEKNATVWNGEFVKMLESKGAKFVSKAVVVDGNIVTANGPNAAKEFAAKIIELLRK